MGTTYVRQPQLKNLTRLYPGIRTRVTGPFLLLIAIVAILAVFIVTRLVAGSIQERFNNQLVDSANAASNAIVEIERQQLATLRLMVFTDGVAAAVEKRDVANLDAWLRPVAANAGLDAMVIFDANGESMLWLRRENNFDLTYTALPDTSVDDWHSVQRVLAAQSDPLGDKFVDILGDDSDSLLYMSAPIRNSDGQVVGGIAIGTSMFNFARRVSEQSLSAVALYDMQGNVLGQTFRINSADALTLPASTVADLMVRVQDTSPIEALEIEGTPFQILYAPFEIRSETIGLLGVALPSNFIVERSSTSRNIFAALFSSLFVGVVAIGLMTARTITRPVQRLVETTRAIRDGDLSKRVDLHTPDELGELGTSFDHMTDNLVKKNRQIRKLYLQQLQETARREAVLTSIRDAVIVLSTDQEIIMQNPAAGDLETRLENDVLSERRYHQIFENPGRFHDPVVVEMAKGYFSTVATPVHLETGELIGHVIVFRDITPIIEAERVKDVMIQQLSHELRTPLTAARGYTDLVKMLDATNLSEQSLEYLDVSLKNLSILEHMINEVIEVSVVSSNQFSIDAVEVNLTDVLEEAAAHWQPTMAQRDLEFEIDIPDSVLCVEGDAELLKQVFGHVLRNAYSYTLPGNGVALIVEASEDDVVVSIVDKGVGIDDDEINRVFERMYRGRSADAGPTDSRGLGLGLYLTQQIIEAHNGTVTLRSKPEVGTLVEITLPLSKRSEYSG